MAELVRRIRGRQVETDEQPGTPTAPARAQVNLADFLIQ